MAKHVQFGSRLWCQATAPRYRLLLHGGLHKTGTTAIQSALAAGSGRLREQHLLYPNAGRPEASDGHHNVAWQLTGDRRFQPTCGTVDDVAAEIAGFPGDAMLSSEDFEGLLGTPERLRPLVNHRGLHDRDITFLIYLREQVAYAESLFAEMQQHGMKSDARRFCDDLLASGEVRFRDWVFHFDYDAWHTRMVRAGIGRLTIRPYAALVGNSAVTDILHFAGRAAPGLIKDAEQRVNKRDTLIQSLARFCAGRLGRDVATIGRRLDELLGAQLARRPAHLSSDRRREIRRRFARGNERLARACGFPLAALDPADASPPGSLDMEDLFSARTAWIVGNWLDGRLGDRQAVASLVTDPGASR